MFLGFFLYRYRQSVREALKEHNWNKRAMNRKEHEYQKTFSSDDDYILRTAIQNQQYHNHHTNLHNNFNHFNHTHNHNHPFSPYHHHHHYHHQNSIGTPTMTAATTHTKPIPVTEL